MFFITKPSSPIRKLDLQRNDNPGRGTVDDTVWLRGEDGSVAFDLPEAQWIYAALGAALLARAKLKPDARGAVFELAVDVRCAHFWDKGVCIKCGAHEDQQIAGKHGKHSAFSDPPDQDTPTPEEV